MAKRTPTILVEWPDPTKDRGKGARATITEAGIKVASKMARAGHPNYGIAATLGLGRDSFTACIARQPELRAAMDTSLGKLEAECVTALVTAMRKGQYVAAIFLLKGKFGFREAGTPDTPVGQTQVNIVIPPRLSDAEYDKIIKNISPKPDEQTEIIEGVVVQQRRIER